MEATGEDGHPPPSPLLGRSEEPLLDSVRPHVYGQERFVNDVEDILRNVMAPDYSSGTYRLARGIH